MFSWKYDKNHCKYCCSSLGSPKTTIFTMVFFIFSRKPYISYVFSIISMKTSIFQWFLTYFLKYYVLPKLFKCFCQNINIFNIFYYIHLHIYISTHSKCAILRIWGDPALPGSYICYFSFSMMPLA